MPVRHKTLMGGTTLCPHCDTRFKIAEPQLEAHQGMVRCGHCLQAFDARPDYIPDQPDPQLELPILDEPAGELPAEKSPATEPATESTSKAGTIGDISTGEETASIEEAGVLEEAVPAPAEETGSPGTAQPGAAPPADEAAAQPEPPETPRGDLLDFHPPAAAEPQSVAPSAADEPVALTLAEQVAIVQDEEEEAAPPAHRRWPWAIAAALLLLALLAQATYFFRVELAARLPGLKPALIGYCQLLGCSVPLPQKTDLMSIESSDLEANPDHENQITLNALLRNRAPYPQAFPNLELTLSDTDDKPLARRIFKPKDYLPPQENELAGLLANHELIVKLYLGTTDLRPTGYRLVLFYPQH